MNLVIPEWLFVQDNADTIMADIDVKALKLMKHYGIKITPMVSNYFNQKWNPENVVRIISSKKRKEKFISSIIRILQGNQFQGRSEEHTSELQSLRHLACRLLLEKQ